MENMNIILIGMMGSGKSSVGKKIAEYLNWSFLDTDVLIEQETQMKISDIFSQKGEPDFRKIETNVIKRLTDRTKTVISTGGGAPCSFENWRYLQGRFNKMVWLKADPKVLLKRLEFHRSMDRPLLKDQLHLERISSLLSQREECYSKADVVIDTDFLSLEQVAEKIIQEVQIS